MEHLKACPTNAQAIGGIDVVYYQTVVVRQLEEPPTGIPKNSARDGLQTVEAALRNTRRLVARDPGRSLLWLFKSGDSDHDAYLQLAEPERIAKMLGFDLIPSSQGQIKATELMTFPKRGFPQGTLSTPRHLHTANPRASTAILFTTHEQRPIDTLAVYELFLSAVIGSLAYDLKDEANLIPLNARTFVFDSQPTATHDSDSTSVLLVTLDVHWGSSGNLIVYWSFLKNNCIVPLPSLLLSEKDAPKKLYLRIAPSGMVGTITPNEILKGSLGSNVPSEKSRRKRCRRQSLDDKSSEWKNMVEAWLESIGIRLAALDDSTSWARIGLENRKDVTSKSHTNITSYLLWPRALCFVYDGNNAHHSCVSEADSDALQSDGGLGSILAASIGSSDCLETARKWLADSAERNSNKIILQQPRGIGKLSVPPLIDISFGPGPSSPLYLRAGVLGDMHAGGGVYPTPPDGILNPSTGVSITTEGPPNSAGIISNDQTNPTALATPILPSQSDPVISDVIDAPNADRELARPEKANEHAMVGDDADDLFEDTDEDEFTGNNVTDADFSFFDEPDDDEMMDVPDIREVDPKSDPISRSSQAPIKLENLDDDHALTVTDPASEDTEAHAYLKIEPVNVTHAQADPLPRTGIGPNNRRQRSPSVTTARKVLRHPSQLKYPPSSRGTAEVPRKESIFDPINFTDKLNLSDDKYLSGRFNFASSALEDDQFPKKHAAFNPSQSLAPIHGHTTTSFQTVQLGMLAHIAVDTSDTTSSSSIDEASINDEDNLEDFDGDMIIPVPLPKRKRAFDERSTPVSALSPSEVSHLGDTDTFEDSVVVSIDPSELGRFEPSPWDWNLAGFPTPSATPTPSSGNISSSSQGTMNPPSLKSDPDNKSTQNLDAEALTKRDVISIAQIFSDQVVTSCLQMLPSLETRNNTDNDTLLDSSSIVELLGTLRRTVKNWFPTAADCHLSQYASLHDPIPEQSQSVKSQHRPVAWRTVNSANPEVAPFHIPSPYIRLRRAETLWDLLPPSLAFWEPLGLAPVSDSKNVMGFCVVPSQDSIWESASSFLDNISLAYEGYKLGTHFRGLTTGNIQNGLVSCDLSQSSTYETAMAAYRTACLELGKTLGALDLHHKEHKIAQQVNTFVIYIVNPFESSKALWDISAAFWGLFQQYGSGPDCIDIVLQTLPIQYLAPQHAPIVLESSMMAKLAREVYDRCPPTGLSGDRSPLHIFSGPAIHLEETLPRTGIFKNTIEPHADPLRENSYMHVGYSVSMDGAWVTSAWTDNFGKYQAFASYHVGNSRSFSEISREIWQTTLDIISKRKVTWRICLVRAGVMAAEESDVWASLVMQPTNLQLSIALLSFVTKPSLAIYPTHAFQEPPSIFEPNTHATTVNTPQPGVSPDPYSLTPAATPSEMAQELMSDPDARLVDVTDETWGMVLAHRLNNSNSVVDFRPSLASGILIKRGLNPGQTSPPFASDNEPPSGPRVMAVNLIFLGAPNRNLSPPTPASSPLAQQDTLIGAGVAIGMGMASTPGTPAATSPIDRPNPGGFMFAGSPQHRATADMFLREILIHYRGLGLLAKLKGMKGTRAGMVPWHVAVCMRSVEALQKGAVV
ncbi:hypothetical protein EJ05DRAFT_285010 [Pseudovirgaria hyperparasitica]|uniref:Mediator of RNA polymerase II transcription subunit 13 n=1 Tax=Pseudovirgaria hyperparasitica TaxID=470096 RepID=A0A6A6WCZ4_9PEZI|nr:uncharacterized protein EJ05DRAFT_285010 [Pseudovirgaria hyperparasitica]KAF2760445.1 hypothetical protein EJ05DRAFT_285010 [Pseudovirgaria hyperparasitica]